VQFRSRLAVLLVSAVAAPLAAQAPAAPAQPAPSAMAAAAAEEAAVRATLELYLRSHATGDGSHVAQAFHPELKLWWVAGDTLATRTAAAYIAGHRGTPPADEAQRRRWIASAEVYGNAAVARVVLDYPTVTFIDLFTLLKINGEWKIVTKTFSSQAKPRG
jgi:hypothetical protein